jgi:hypothetical protein
VDGENFTGPDIVWCRLRDIPSAVDDGLGGESAWDAGSLVLSVSPKGCDRNFLYNKLYLHDDYEIVGDMVGAGCEIQGDACDSLDDFGEKRQVAGRVIRQIKAQGAQVIEVYQPEPWNVTDSLVIGPLKKGDSGGPLIVRMRDGSHRVIGIANFIDQKNNYQGSGQYHNFVYYAPLPLYLRWIEKSSDENITPCLDWEEGIGYVFDSDCEAYHGDPSAGAGAWSNGCYAASDRIEPTRCSGAAPWETLPPPVIAASAGSESGLDLTLAVAKGEVDEDEAILFGGPVLDEQLGTRDDDVLLGTVDDEVFRAGMGNDIVLAGMGADAVMLGLGDDMALTDGGDDRVHPGEGRDIVSTGCGDDAVIIHDPCEQEPGEMLLGGSGHDVLVTPLTQAELWAIGVVAWSFEEVIVTDQFSDRATCVDGTLELIMTSVPNADEEALACFPPS